MKIPRVHQWMDMGMKRLRSLWLFTQVVLCRFIDVGAPPRSFLTLDRPSYQGCILPEESYREKRTPLIYKYRYMCITVTGLSNG